MTILMQYVGDKNNRKIFIDVTYKTMVVDGNDVFLSQSCYSYLPITPNEFQKYIDINPQYGRIEVTCYKDVFGAYEGLRDTYPYYTFYHIPGFKHISSLTIGSLIPVYGFTAVETLSVGDSLILSKKVSLNNYIRSEVTE
jgi:hypothetical protein